MKKMNTAVLIAALAVISGTTLVAVKTTTKSSSWSFGPFGQGGTTTTVKQPSGTTAVRERGDVTTQTGPNGSSKIFVGGKEINPATGRFR